MQLVLDNKHPNFDSIEHSKCSVIILCYCKNIYITILNDLQSKFIYIGKYNKSEEDSFSIDKWAKKLNINPNIFRKILIVYQTQNSFLISKNKFNSNYLESHINLICPIFNKDINNLQQDYIKNENIYNNYFLNYPEIEINENIEKNKIKQYHLHTFLIKLINIKLKSYYNNKNNFCKIILNENEFTILIYLDQKFHNVNTYNDLNPEEVVYKLLSMLTILKIEFNNIFIFISFFEESEFTNKTIELLNIYFRKIKIEERPISFNYDYGEDDSKTFFSPLFELALCE